MTTSSFPIRNGSGTDPEELDERLNEHVREPGDPDGVVAAEERQRWQERRPSPPSTPRAERIHKRRWAFVLIAVVVIAGVVAGSYWLGSHEASKKNPPVKTHNTTSDSQAALQAEANTTKSYTSTNFSLSFSYPGDWVVNDTTAKLTVTSPAVALQSAVGAKVKAHVVVTVQNQQSSIAGFPTGGAVAALASDQLTYKQPSSDQRSQTYLSYLSYTEPNGLDELYLTGNTAYQQGQQVPMSDITPGNPLISVGFENCQSINCATGSKDAITLQASAWKTSAVSQQVTTLIQSIVITG